MRPFATAALAVLALSSTSCDGCSRPPPPPPLSDAGTGVLEPPVEASVKADLVWKRARAFERGLMAALLVDDDQVCEELGRFPCVDLVHQTALGGNDPFEQGLYQPIEAPGATTAAAVDRVVLAACAAAVENERARPVPVLFRGVDVEAPALDASDPEVLEAVDFDVRELYRRVLARDPIPAEIGKMRELLVDDQGAPVSGRDFAVLSCFAVATTTENLFF